MILWYNGQRLKEQVSYRVFRKFAYKYKIKYQSWEEGEWIEMEGRRKIKTIRKLLR